MNLFYFENNMFHILCANMTHVHGYPIWLETRQEKVQPQVQLKLLFYVRLMIQ